MTTHESERNDAERLSALMDDELSPPERAELLGRLENEPFLQARWARYHAARSALNIGAARLSPDFVERVRQAREQEPAVLAPKRARPARPAWVRPLVGVAIAASVALVAIGGLNLLRGSLPATSPVTVADNDGAGVTIGDTGTSAITPVAVSSHGGATMATPEPVRKRLMLYLTSHNEYADTVEVPTVVPYGRLSSLNAGQ